jgi:AraC-like DNA-binding protein
LKIVRNIKTKWASICYDGYSESRKWKTRKENMDRFDLINLTIAHIEKWLMQPITTAEVAAATGYSRAHLGRLFLEMTGETLAGYIRKRRLSEAARRLVTTHASILDLALDYQFESQEAFTRSFKRLFRLSPGAYRKRGRFAGAFLRITLSRPRIMSVQLHALFTRRVLPNAGTQAFDTLYLWYA